jgi:hypothetical protein
MERPDERVVFNQPKKLGYAVEIGQQQEADSNPRQGTNTHTRSEVSGENSSS